MISIVLFPADRYGVTLQESWVPNWKLFAFASRQVVATLFISTEYVLSVAISRDAETTVPAVTVKVLTNVNVSLLLGSPTPSSSQIQVAPGIDAVHAGWMKETANAFAPAFSVTVFVVSETTVAPVTGAHGVVVLIPETSTHRSHPKVSCSFAIGWV